MTAKEIQKRNEKAQNLRVIQVDDSVFYVRERGRKDLLQGLLRRRQRLLLHLRGFCQRFKDGQQFPVQTSAGYHAVHPQR